VGWVALLAFALRLYHVAAQGLWADEAFTVEYAALPLAQLIRTVAAVDPHPAGYYLIVKGWTSLAGGGDFAVRFVSVWSGALTVAALFALVRRIAGIFAGGAAALLLALSPLSVWYGQEARQYELLALGATLATLLLRRALERGSWGSWLVYAAVLAGTLHLQYFAIPLAAFHAYLAQRAVLWRPDRWRAVVAFAVAGALFLPWWLAARALEYGGWMERVDLATAARRTAWAFAAGTTIYPEYGWTLAAPTTILVAVGVFLLLARRLSRGDLLLLLGWAIVPLLAAYGIGVVSGRPAYHERYVSLGLPGWLGLAGVGVGRLVGTGLGWLRRARSLGGLRGPSVGLAGAAAMLLGLGPFAAALAADGVSLRWEFFDPHFAKEDLRAAAAFLAPRATPDDLMIGAPGRLGLYRRYAKVTMPSLATDVAWDSARAEREVAQALPGHRRVWLLPNGSDVDRQVEAQLDRRGYRLDGAWFGLAPLKSWAMSPDPPERVAGAKLGRADRTLLEAKTIGVGLDRAADGYLVEVVGDWERTAEVGDLKESLRLLDGRGRVVSQVDRPFGGEVDPPRLWPANEVRTVRSALRVAPDLPSGRYAVRLVLYDASGPLPVQATGVAATADWKLGELDLAPLGPVPAALVEAAGKRDGDVGPTLRLVGEDLPTTPIPAGGIVPVVLHWQSVVPNAFGGAAFTATRVGLRDDQASTGPLPDLPRRAPAAPGSLLRDDRRVRIPRSTAPGWHDLVLFSDGRPGEGLTIGRVHVGPGPPPRVAPAPRTAVAGALGPVAVSGYDLDGIARPGGRLDVAVHLRVVGELPEDLTVFVHLTDGTGRPVAQHDGPPCGGGCPTTTWAPGDEIVDRETVTLPGSLPPGSYGLTIGLYDPNSGARLKRSDHAPPDQPDFVRLGTVDVTS